MNIQDLIAWHEHQTEFLPDVGAPTNFHHEAVALLRQHEDDYQVSQIARNQLNERLLAAEAKYQSAVQDWRNACELMNKAEAKLRETEKALELVNANEIALGNALDETATKLRETEKREMNAQCVRCGSSWFVSKSPVPEDVARDAARYRWLRDYGPATFISTWDGRAPLSIAIDAAMQKGKNND